jgi:hypothetical protein
MGGVELVERHIQGEARFLGQRGEHLLEDDVVCRIGQGGDGAIGQRAMRMGD